MHIDLNFGNKDKNPKLKASDHVRTSDQRKIFLQRPTL